MKRIFWGILLLSFGLFAQTKTYLPIDINSSNGRPLNNKTVTLTNTGSTTTVATLTYLTNSDGQYYWTGGTSTVPWGDYDVYVNGKLYRTDISIRNGYTIAQVARDTVTQVLSDSLPEFAPRTFQYKDTVSLKATVFDSAGFVVNLKQLSSSNTLGGGQFELRPAAEFIVDGITTFTSASASFEWVRVARIQKLPINVEWAGAVHDGSTNDAPAINNAIDKAVDYNLDVYGPSGTYRVTDPVRIPADKPTTRDIRFFGDGIFRTIIDAADTAMVVAFSTYKQGVIIEHMMLNGPGKTTANSVGLFTEFVTKPIYGNLRIEDFESCMKANKIEGADLFWLFFDNAKYGFNGRDGVTLNGIVARNCYMSSGVDSVQWDIGSGSGFTLLGGEAGNTDIVMRVGNNSGGGIARVNILGINWESADSTFLIIENLSSVEISSSRLLHKSGFTGYSGQLYGDSRLVLTRVEHEQITGGGHYYTQNGNSKVYSLIPHKGKFVRVFRADLGDYYSASPWETVADNAVPTPDSSRAGQLLNMFSRSSTNVPDEKLAYHRFSNDEFGYTNILQGSDWRTASTDVQPATPNKAFRFVQKSFNVTFAASGDSTIYTAILDTNGWSSFHGILSCHLDNAGNSGHRPHVTFRGIQDDDGANGTGTVDLILSHNGDASVNGITRRIFVIGIITPREWGTN
jgi:hypothetical protein